MSRAIVIMFARSKISVLIPTIEVFRLVITILHALRVNPRPP